MRKLTWTAALAVSALSFAQNTVTVPSTGASSASGLDTNWTVESHLAGEAGSGHAALVGTPLPGGWVTPDPGTTWISVQADQRNATRPGNCCVGGTIYRVNFTVTDPANAQFTIKIAADEAITMHLNGDYTDDNSIVYSTIASTYTSPVTITVKQGAPYTDPGGYSHTVHFVAGVNTIAVEVDNYGGGPTGLYISSVAVGSAAPSSYTSTAPAAGATNSVPDPVDSGSGQFYDTEVDFRLGGPMQIGFSRWYSSQLATSGVTSGLGTNWMGTYDAAALVKGTKAQVLLFGGRVVTFNNSAGAWRLASPLSSGFQFGAVTSGFQFLDPGSEQIYTFTQAGVLSRIEDRNGNALTVTPGPNGPTKVADGLGRTLAFTYDGAQLASVQDQSGRTTNYTYASGLLASVTDPTKAVTNYTYTAVGALKGLLTKETLPLGNSPVTQTYDVTGRVLTQTGTTNNTAKLTYDGLGGTTILDANSNTTRHKNDDIGDILQISDPLGGVASMVYDGSQRRTSATDRTGGTLQYVYDPHSSAITAVTDQNGNTTAYTFNPLTRGPFTFYDLAGITYPDNLTANLTYDPNGNLLSATAPDGATTSYSYDTHGQLTQATDALGNSTVYSRNTDGTIASVQDALANITKFEYDSLKRVVKATDPNARVEQYTYDGAGRPASYVLPEQSPWQLHFNANGQIDTLTNPLAGQFAFTFTPAGQLATQIDPLKNTATFSYDNLNQITKVQIATGEATTYTRDALGRITAATDNSGPILQYGYDAEGRILSQTDATGLTTSYGYTKAGQLTSITTPTGNTLAFGYDVRGNLITRTSPLGDQYTFTYDAEGRVLGINGPGGFSTSFLRDANGMPTSFTSANGNTWTMTYDALQRLASMTDPLGNATSYTYQGLRLSHIDFPLGSVDYTYDTLGRVSQAQYSDGTVIHSIYNAMGQITDSDHLAMRRDAMGRPTSVNGIVITRDADGKALTMTYAPGKAVTYTYDQSGRVDSVSDWTGGKTSLAYDPASRRTTQTLPNGVSTTFSYDAEGRRNGITYGTLGSIAITYDANGRITSADRNLPTAPTLQDNADQFSFNAAGQLTEANYDSMGRVTSQGARTYTWDLATQMTSFADPVNSGTMTYDGALGEMWSSTATGVKQNFVFNYAMEYPALAIVRQGTIDKRYYVYLPDGELLYGIDASDGSRIFYHFDEMGNTAFLSDNSGAVTDSYAITPYGEIADHLGTTDNPFTWQGQFGVMQEANGLFYMRSRHYDASTARFLSPDPIMDAEPQTSEPYAYARGNPMLYTDPFGSCWPWDLGCLAQAVKTQVSRAVTAVKNTVASVAKAVSTVFQKTPATQVKAPVKTTPKAPAVASLPQLPVPSALISQDGSGLQSLVTSGLISQDGSGLILRLEGVISNDGGSLRALSQLISQDGAGVRALIGLIGQDGSGLARWAKLIGQDGSGLLGLQKLISQDGSGVISNDGGSVISNDGGSFGGYGQSATSFVPSTSSYRAATPKPKNNKN